MLDGGARRILELLEGSVPPPRRGTRLLDQALELAGLATLPGTNVELREFVRKALRPVLAVELGDRLAGEVAHDLEAALSPALRRIDTVPSSPSSRRMRATAAPTSAVSSAPSSAPSRPPSSGPVASVRGEGRIVIVLGHDRLATSTIARALIGCGFQVSVAHDAQELLLAVAGGNPSAVLCDDSSAREHAAELKRLAGSAVVVHGCRDPKSTEHALADAGLDRAVGVADRASSRDLVVAVARLTGACAGV
ncbi:MAG: hypothetical protein HYV09_00945 [Deltaproteobacteria bacterium]|nr:hypothetical protein [Deltaproteobacteria bacterium]